MWSPNEVLQSGVINSGGGLDVMQMVGSYSHATRNRVCRKSETDQRFYLSIDQFLHCFFLGFVIIIISVSLSTPIEAIQGKTFRSWEELPVSPFPQLLLKLCPLAACSLTQSYTKGNFSRQKRIIFFYVWLL